MADLHDRESRGSESPDDVGGPQMTVNDMRGELPEQHPYPARRAPQSEEVSDPAGKVHEVDGNVFAARNGPFPSLP
jgi:hypothetical protein